MLAHSSVLVNRYVIWHMVCCFYLYKKTKIVINTEFFYQKCYNIDFNVYLSLATLRPISDDVKPQDLKRSSKSRSHSSAIWRHCRASKQVFLIISVFFHFLSILWKKHFAKDNCFSLSQNYRFLFYILVKLYVPYLWNFNKYSVINLQARTFGHQKLASFSKI